MSYQNADKTILIEIPAYKDPDLLNTVSSALIQAEFPERIHFGVCYQDDDLVVLKKLRVIPNTQVIHVPLSEARGSCYASNLCQKLLSDEDYIFHIDSSTPRAS